RRRIYFRDQCRGFGARRSRYRQARLKRQMGRNRRQARSAGLDRRLLQRAGRGLSAAARRRVTKSDARPSAVMPGPVPGIHVFSLYAHKTWMARASPARTTLFSGTSGVVAPNVPIVPPYAFIGGAKIGTESAGGDVMPNVKWLSVVVLSVALSTAAFAAGRGGGGHGGRGGHGGC